MARDPTKLEVYHLAHRLALSVYRLTEQLPREERFGLQAQLRRAVVSTPANIVEGAVRLTSAEDARFLEIALGSAVEVRYLLDLVKDLGLSPGEQQLDDCQELSDHVVRALLTLQRMVGGFKTVDRDTARTTPGAGRPLSSKP